MWAHRTGLPRPADSTIPTGPDTDGTAARRVSRADQDEWAATSQRRAQAAIESGFFATDITPVTLADGTVVASDDGPRVGVSIESLAGLNPVFRPDGTVTAGNCCPLNDGAAALVIMSGRKATELGITPLVSVGAALPRGSPPGRRGWPPARRTRPRCGRHRSPRPARSWCARPR